MAIQARKIKRLFWDIETSPNVVFSWRVGYKINIDYENIIQERSIICIGYKWEDDDRVHVLQWDKDHNDRQLLETFIPILESADEVVAHYGDKFDLPWVRARAAFHGLSVSPYIKTIDTKAQSSRLFYFNANRLDYLGQYLGLGRKIETDFKLWKDVFSGNKTALKQMVTYCKRDVVLLEKVYKKLAGYHKPKTNVSVLLGGSKVDCPRCASTNVQKRGTRVSEAGTISQTMWCKDCDRYYSVTIRAVPKTGKLEGKK